jgi:hypothetical protein
MGLGPFIVTIKELKVHVFNAKGREKYVCVLEESPIQLIR